MQKQAGKPLCDATHGFLKISCVAQLWNDDGNHLGAEAAPDCPTAVKPKKGRCEVKEKGKEKVSLHLFWSNPSILVWDFVIKTTCETRSAGVEPDLWFLAPAWAKASFSCGTQPLSHLHPGLFQVTKSQKSQSVCTLKGTQANITVQWKRFIDKWWQVGVWHCWLQYYRLSDKGHPLLHLWFNILLSVVLDVVKSSYGDKLFYFCCCFENGIHWKLIHFWNQPLVVIWGPVFLIGFKEESWGDVY